MIRQGKKSSYNLILGMCAKFYQNRMVRFQNRRNRTRWTSDVFWIMRSAPGPSPASQSFLWGKNSPGPPSGGEVVAVALPRCEENVY